MCQVPHERLRRETLSRDSLDGMVRQVGGPVQLQESLYRLCRRQIDQSPGFEVPPYLRGLQTVDHDTFEAFRLYKLKKIVSYVYRNSTFYKRLFDRCGIVPEDIQSFSDLVRLPLTDPADVSANPFGFLCVSQGEVARVITFTTSGTVGPRKKIFFTERDIEVMTDFMAAGINTVTGPSGVVQILLPFSGQLGQADLLASGVRKMGARAVITGMDKTSTEQIEAIKKHGSTVLFGETRLIHRITKEAESTVNLRKLGVKCLFTTTGYLSNSMKKYLESVWGCEVRSHYGLTEMGLGLAVDCACGSGYHFNELDVIGEVIDPNTGQAVPDREEGELVFTTLTREAMPLIRYRTHDISRIDSTPCRCTPFLKRIDYVRKRLESEERIGKYRIYPSLFDDLIYQFPEVVDYRVRLGDGERGARLTLDIEVTRAGSELKERITRAVLGLVPLEHGLRAGNISDVVVNLLCLGSLRGEMWVKRTIRKDS